MRSLATMAILSLLLAGAGFMSPARASETTVVYPQHDTYWSGRVRADISGYHKQNNEMFFSYHMPDTAWHSFAKFDLSPIPDDAVIESASFSYYTVMVSDPPPPNDIRLIASDPVTADPQQLWSDIVTGMVASEETVHGTGWIERPLNGDGLAGLSAALVQDWFALGIHKTDDSYTRGVASGYANAQFPPYLSVTYSPPMPDLEVVAVNAPEVLVEAGTTVVPELAVRNDGNVDVPFVVTFVLNDPEGEVYSEQVSYNGLGVGQQLSVAFPEVVIDAPLGEWSASGRVTATGDVNPANDQKVRWFIVWQGGADQPALTYGWEEVRRVPLGPESRPVRHGSWLAFDASRGLVYAAKGNKTGELYSVDPLTRAWQQLAPMPYESHPRWTRPPARGARGVSDNRGNLYVVQGNNTLGFWRYDISAGAWQVMPDVPLGLSRRKVKGGDDMAYVEVDGQGYVYLLKGYRTEMYRFDVAADAWEVLPDAPSGGKGNWDSGSWLVYDGDRTIYAHKARNHGMWSFDVVDGKWDPDGLSPMPYKGQSMRKRRMKDGGSADWFDGAIYSLKGGNTGEFWRYAPEYDAWVEMPPMPETGTTGRPIRVRHGGDLVTFAPGRAFYAYKGNSTVEFWRYRMPPDGYLPPGGEAAGAALRLRPGADLTLSPNPVTGRQARASYVLPFAARATVGVYDPAGRLAVRQELEAGQRGAVTLDLGWLSAGVYVVRLEAGGQSVARKLVLQR